MGHLIASDAIRQLRHEKEGIEESDHYGRTGDLQELCRVMSTRTTSLARDKMIIAGLLCLGPTFQFSTRMSDSQITKSLLRNFGWIRQSNLFHAE